MVSQRKSITWSQYCALEALLFTVFFTTNAIAAQNHIDSQLISKPTPFPVCIDDSDCVKMGEGNKYACFQYLCYPWRDDSGVPAKDRKQTCRNNVDCDQGQLCFRHQDKRNVVKGLCFDKVQTCNVSEDCPKDFGCCGGSCCENQYYKIFTGLPCISHMGCQDLSLGKFCCPPKGGNGKESVCCDIDPNPPPTTPYPQPSVGGGATLKPIFSVIVQAILFFVFASRW